MDDYVMSNITNKYKYGYKYGGIPRRKILAAGTAFLAVCATSTASLAGIGTKSDLSSEKFNRNRDAVRYSQDEFLELDRSELTYLYNYRIDGFQDHMGPNLVKMMLDNRASMRQLMLDMDALKAPGERQARLSMELGHATSIETGLAQSINSLVATQGSSGDVAVKKRQLRRAKGYVRGVKAWNRYPREGTYKTSCTFSVGSIVIPCKPPA